MFGLAGFLKRSAPRPSYADVVRRIRLSVARSPGSQAVHRERRAAFACGDVDRAESLLMAQRPVQPSRRSR